MPVVIGAWVKGGWVRLQDFGVEYDDRSSHFCIHSIHHSVLLASLNMRGVD